MKNTFKIYLSLFVLVVMVLVIIEMKKTPVQSWNKNFELDKKSPFGLYVFNQEVNHLFKDDIKQVAETPYTYYENNDKLGNHNILIVESQIDETSWKAILKKVSLGSSVVYISENIPKILRDSLNFQNERDFYGEQMVLRSTDKKYRNDSLIVDKGSGPLVISYIDKRSTEILGYGKHVSSNKKNKYAAFVKVKYGKGEVYIHTQPIVLTNYFLLNKNSKQYVESIFSYLPKASTIWFLEAKQGKTANNNSPLRFIFANPPLKYAWYLLLSSLFIFVFFNAKRRQRIIPIIEPLKNASVEFVRTIGNLYLQEGSPKDMMIKKSQYFLYRVRTDMMMDTRKLDEEFIEKLHQKTGQKVEKVRKIVSIIKNLHNEKYTPTKDHLIEMNTLLDDIIKH